MLGAEHAILLGLRERRLEPELTRVLASAFAADAEFAGAFVHALVRSSKRASDPRWERLSRSFECRAEVPLREGRVDLEFTDLAEGWRVLVELKIDAGYGFEQIRRYLRCLDAADDRQVLASITRDEPRYGDPPLDEHDGWLGSMSWAKLMPSLRQLRPANDLLAVQWPLLLDILEDEGAMGVTNVDPELLEVWSRSFRAREHAVAFVESLRAPLLEALRDALEPVFPELPREERAEAAPAPTAGRRPQVDVEFFVPATASVCNLSTQLWAWEDFRFSVSARYPEGERSLAAREAVARLVRGGFENWRDRWLWVSLPLDTELLAADDLQARLLDWARARFGEVAGSELLRLAPASSSPETDEETA